MALEQKKRVAYLFGAGATHAELLELEPDILQKNQGLLIGHVSKRVIEKARANKHYRLNLETVSATKGSGNIELLISLLENSKVHDWASKTKLLKDLVEKDIKAILTPSRLRKFYLHRALFQLHHHKAVRAREEVVGFISLNYDGVLDQAYRKHHGEPNYCFSLDDSKKLMDKRFGKKAEDVSSRAVAVSAYLFVEDLFLKKKVALVTEFAKFFVALLSEIKENLDLLAKYQNPTNRTVLEDFQKYISQASVEPYAIKRRHEFLEKAFQYFRSPKGKGKIIGRG